MKLMKTEGCSRFWLGGVANNPFRFFCTGMIRLVLSGC